MLSRNEVALIFGALVIGRRPQVALLSDAEVVIRLSGDLGEVQEQLDGVSDQLEFLTVVELEPERSGGRRCGERARSRAALDDDYFEPGPRGVEGGRRADDSAAYDDELRAPWGLGRVGDARDLSLRT